MDTPNTTNTGNAFSRWIKRTPMPILGLIITTTTLVLALLAMLFIVGLPFNATFAGFSLGLTYAIISTIINMKRQNKTTANHKVHN